MSRADDMTHRAGDKALRAETGDLLRRTTAGTQVIVDNEMFTADTNLPGYVFSSPKLHTAAVEKRGGNYLIFP